MKLGCQKFHQYILGKKLSIETDHKPLESIFKKSVDDAPPRLKRIVLDVQQYSPTVIYKKGCDIPIADALSRDCDHSNEADEKDEELEVHLVLSMSTEAKERYIKATEADPELQNLISVINTGWPDDISDVEHQLKPYFNYRDELSYYEGLVFKGNKIFVPKSEVNEILETIHASHQGIQSCLHRARQTVFWKNMTQDIANYVERCAICQSTQRCNDKEKIVTRKVPEYPWQIVASDLFFLSRRRLCSDS